MSVPPSIEALLREVAPQALGVVARRSGDLAGADDAVQEALIAASAAWPRDGLPDNPLGWLVAVALRRLADGWRSDDARRRRELLATSEPQSPPDAVPEDDDTLVLMLLCCHPALTPGQAIPLTLRAVGGLTTREIAAAFLMPEATMAQRISRAKARIRDAGVRFAMPAAAELEPRLAAVRHVLYLLFTEGHTSTGGATLARPDLAQEAIRLARELHQARPDDPETSGLLALMLLTDARRAARTGPNGALVPLDEQDRTRWDRRAIREGVALVTAALRRGRLGEYQAQAAIAAVHGQARHAAETDWGQIVALYDRLLTITPNPVVRLNRAAAIGVAHGPRAGLAALEELDDELGDHHRLHAVRAHLLERAGEVDAALEAYARAADGTTNARERDHLLLRAARLRAARTTPLSRGA